MPQLQKNPDNHASRGYRSWGDRGVAAVSGVCRWMAGFRKCRSIFLSTEQPPQLAAIMEKAFVGRLIVNVAGSVLGIAGSRRKDRRDELAIAAVWWNGRLGYYCW
jgi:hypothetical protein